MAHRSILIAPLVCLVLGAGCGDDAVAPVATTPDLTSSTSPERMGFPGQPEGVPWPTEGWATGPWPERADRAAVDQATEIAFAGGAADRVRAVVIVHGGAIVYERHSPNPDDGADVVMPSYSIAKSITSAAVGVLVRDGELDVDDVAPVPEWHEDADDPRADATIEHMLHMATGVPWEDGLMEGDDMLEMAQRDDHAAYAASLPATTAPGEVFDYNTGTTMLLARVIGDTVGGGPDGVRAFLERRLFGPLGMGVEVAYDDAGTWLGGYRADATARDYAKLGLLYARGGLWDGERILDEAWVEYTRTPSPSNPAYGAHWWLDTERPGVSYAIGIRGQVITVDPAHDLVIVQLSTVGGDLPLAHTEAILDAFTFVDP